MTEPPTAPPRRGRPRTTGDLTCDRCLRHTGKIRVRWPDGRVCGICFREATSTVGVCDQCGDERLLPGRDGDCRLCRSCAGIVTELDCRRCGREGELYRRGACVRCALRDDLSALLLPAGSEPLPELARLVDVLVAVDRPESIHGWNRNPKVKHLLGGLGAGSITLDHDSLDGTPPGHTREHLRHILMHHQLLPHRDADLARLDSWLQRRLQSIDDPLVRQPIEQFANWHHLPRIRSRVRRGDDVRGAVNNTKQEITEIGRFLVWLADQGKALATCQQADLDCWLVGGPTTRHAIATFVSWTTQQRLSPTLAISRRPVRSARLITHEERMSWLGRCLTGTPDTLAYRVAAVLLLLYAQPIVRIAELQTNDVHLGKGAAHILLGKRATLVPEPFAGVLREHGAARPNMRTGNANNSPWLFPSSRAGRHLSATTIMNRLRDLGIDLLGSRNASLRQLVRQVPAPIVASQLGYSTPVTLKHAALAAEPMQRYAALRGNPDGRR